MNKAFFFDRDGVVNHRIMGDYVKKIEELVIYDDFIEIFRLVKSKGYMAVLVTNQQGIGKGLMTDADLAKVHDYMQDILEQQTGYNFDALYYCSDLAGAGSLCRKPAPGMFLNAIAEHNITPDESWTLGDSKSDILAGKAAGTRTLWLTPSTDELPECDYRFPTHRDVLEFLKKEL